MTNTHIQPWAIILAAGAGSRLASSTQNIPKQFLAYHDAPLYWHSAKVMSNSVRVAGIIFVFPKEYLVEEESRLIHLQASISLGIPWLCVAGGARRQDSVWHGLQALPPTCEHVLIHDAARPFASASLIQRLCTALATDATNGVTGIIPGLAVVDTIKKVETVTGTEKRKVQHTPDRSTLYAVQTPQLFSRTALVQAHKKAQQNHWEATDDASLLERCEYTVHIIDGEPNNTKITTAKDLTLLQEHTIPIPRTGFGYDVHRFGVGRPLKLGSVLMDGAMEVIAHSDGDVLLHALMDALLGCAGEGDIGLHFPDSSPAFDNADSAALLQNVLHIVRQKNLRLVHVDITIITQKPKIHPQRKAIQKNVAHLLGIAMEYVNIKATTEEKLGFTGNLEGIKVVALVTALSVGLPQRKGQ